MGARGNLGKVNCGNLDFALGLSPGVMGSRPPQARRPRRRRRTLTQHAAVVYGPNFSFTFNVTQPRRALRAAPELLPWLSGGTEHITFPFAISRRYRLIKR